MSNVNNSSDMVNTSGDGAATGDADWLSSCVHCGFCLEACPTYRISGDENNSPRGRLRLWKQEAQGVLPPDDWTDHYTRQCVGCLACQTACPAAVPYGQILQQVRSQHVAQRRSRAAWPIRLGDALARRPRLFSAVAAPVRLLRRLGMLRSAKSFPGQPAVWQSTAAYAEYLVDRYRPSGPRVALFSGCLMDAAFREINFATLRVLVRNQYHIVVPPGQTCCGALGHHIGSGGTKRLRDTNRTAFSLADVDMVVTNAAGCGLELTVALDGVKPVIDVIDLLQQQDHPIVVAQPQPKAWANAQLYLDLPCHRLHGSGNRTIPNRLLDATRIRWQLAPDADHCCGAGGTYHIEQPHAAAEILSRKSAFLESAAGDPAVVVSTNHVCLMQWHSAVHRLNRQAAARTAAQRWQVRHLVQLLDSDARN